MMKKALIIICALSVFAPQLWAEMIDGTTAQQLALSFVQSMDGPGNTPVANRVMTVNSSTNPLQPVLYIYNTYTRVWGNRRFVIVAGDNRAREILAYGDRWLDVDNIPDAMQEMIELYRQQIESLLCDDIDEGEMLAGGATSVGNVTEKVGPLLTTMWGQGAPYNNMTPEYPEDSGEHCSTGCGSTAMSMILAYPQNRYVNLLEPVPAYVTSTLGIALDALPPIDFDWDNMLDVYKKGQYTAIEANAVAQLMRYVGQAELMDYTAGASISEIHKIKDALKRFGYNRQLAFFSQYEDSTWEAIIQTEMQAGRPVLYCASNPSGHAFVIDGYELIDNADYYYHINWGWNGSGNCHCLLNAFKPDNTTSAYNQTQAMIFGIHPAPKTITVDKHRLEFEAYTGYTQTQTLTITGENLSEDLKIEVMNIRRPVKFVATPSVITPAEAAAGKTVTVEFVPLVSGYTDIWMFISSNEIETDTINLAGTSIRSEGYINVDSTTIHITDTITHSPSDGIKSITIPVQVTKFLGMLVVNNLPGDDNAARRSIDEIGTIDTDSVLENMNVCSYELTGDSCYWLGSEDHYSLDTDSDGISFMTHVGCDMTIYYNFNTIGQHDATLTIRGNGFAAQPIVINLIGMGVFPDDAGFVYGDANGDGVVNVADVTALVAYILGQDVTINTQAADMNGDGIINVADVTVLIRYVLD